MRQKAALNLNQSFILTQYFLLFVYIYNTLVTSHIFKQEKVLCKTRKLIFICIVSGIFIIL